jgi:hypothetical protein
VVTKKKKKKSFVVSKTVTKELLSKEWRFPLTGPPMAPRSTASASLAAVRSSSANGVPVASIAA